MCASPRQDERYDADRELPRLVLVRSSDKKHAEIAGTGWWGNKNMSPTAIAVEASPALVRKISRPGDPSFEDKHPPANIGRARWRDVAIHARGFWAPTILATLAAVAAIAGAVVAIVAISLPLGIVLAFVAFVAVVELGKAAKDIAESAHRP